MEIVKIPLDSLTPYKRNAKKRPEAQIRRIMQSIELYGDNDPIAVWGKKNVIVEGHGRYEALKRLGRTEADCIRLDHLTDKERKEYTLVHNKLTMDTDFDFDILGDELSELDFGGVDFGFDLCLPDVDNDSFLSSSEPVRAATWDKYRLEEYDEARTAGRYQFPTLAPCLTVPKALLSFHLMMTSTPDKDTAIHFFTDDYRFERIWASPYMYIKKIQKFGGAFTPDFSLYMDMPLAMKIWNVYRSRLIGQMMQDAGLAVIPTLQFAGDDTLDWCFEGLPKHSTVAVSSVGVMKNSDAKKVWLKGMAEAMRQLKPETVIIYGVMPDFDFLNVKVYTADNAFSGGNWGGAGDRRSAVKEHKGKEA